MRQVRIMVRAAAVAVVLGVLCLVAPQADAAPPNLQYDYTDPAQTGCSASATTIWAKDLTNPASGVITGRMEVRYSTACQTNWVRVNNYVNGATARKIIQRYRTNAPEGGSVPFAEDSTADTYFGWSYGLQFYAPSWVCVAVGGVIELNGQTIGINGQGLDQVC
jgi:hypothetical protein